ncbi:beta-catenin-like protein 1 [Anopheles ziemanni]|uniref:beta-catenin-like protein 1 n=1 Tax=Anopheles coustani TaxID=139045 RepID=UPI0026593425|nr:beta-catenin-like protein 1 [Anopheles coustani]XP_058172091.1 beta-catenin-like protein 1 [Anopheles ziemanni]
MDIGELLSFKPEQTPKRPSDFERENQDDDDADNSPDPSSRSQPPQKARRSEQATGVRGKPSLPAKEPQITEQERLDILKFVETEEPDGDVLDDSGLKKMLLLFEKRVLKNQEMRIKFPESAEKFMESEIELNDAIQEMHAVATVPDLYPLLVDLNGVASLLELLSHQNSDISVAVVDLLQELTDVDILHESMDGAETLIEALRKQQAAGLLVQNLERLDESVKEEADGVHNTLAIFENLIEIKSDIANEVAAQGLLQWILKRLRAKMPFDANKLYCSEILSILVQDTNENRILLGNIDGIDVLLQQLAAYKRHDPSSAEEQEFMENLFNSLCSALMAKENREKFLKGEGLQLMNLMLREKKLSRNGSLKVLDHAMSGPDGRDNCNKFVDILGLRTIFPLFMKTPKRNKKRLLSTDEHEEHIVSIIASMLRNCKGSQRQRLLAKFTENDYEKVERIMELHRKYLDKVEAMDREIDQQMRADDEEQDDDMTYVKRLSGGLFTLQLVDYIILEISCTDVVKQRVVKILNLHNGSMKMIRNVMREFAGNLGDAGDSDWREQEQSHILQLIDRF